jgi:hypothetical protein
MCPIFETNPKVLKKKKEKVKEEEATKRKKRAKDSLQHLQQKVGNQTVQRLVVQRSQEAGFNLDDETGKRIQAERGSGESLESGVQANMGKSFDQDFSGVRVHTSSEADTLNREIGAKAFTTGKDIFFRSGAYDPDSQAGQHLIAHELTHVVQQGGSAGQENTAFRVHPAGDAYEQEADATARQVMDPSSPAQATAVQRQPIEEEEELIQPQEEEEDELLLQEDTEEELFLQEEEEEEEEEEEAVQMQDEEMEEWM